MAAAADAAVGGPPLAPESFDEGYSLFVGEIARGTTDEAMRQAFRRFGEVSAALVVRDRRTGATRGYGFVRFVDPRSVSRALDDPRPPQFTDAVTGLTLPCRTCAADPKNTLYVGRVPRELGEERVRRDLESACPGDVRVVRFDLHLDAEGRSRGFGWARFRDHAEAVRALRALCRERYPGTGTRMTVRLAPPRCVDYRLVGQMKALYVRNVVPETPMEELRAFFGGEERVERVFLPTERGTRKFMGTAIVHYKERRFAEELLPLLDGREFHGRRLHAEWCLPPDAAQPSPPLVASLPPSPVADDPSHRGRFRGAASSAPSVPSRGPPERPRLSVVRPPVSQLSSVERMHRVLESSSSQFTPFVPRHLPFNFPQQSLPTNPPSSSK